MRNLTVLVLVLASSSIHGSDLAESWAPSWTIDVTSFSCELRRRYFVPSGGDPDSAGLLSGSIYDSISLLFSATTKPGDDARSKAAEDNLFFMVQGTRREGAGDGRWKIETLRVGSFETKRHLIPHTGVEVFVLTNEESLGVLEEFRAHKAVRFSAQLSNGDKLDFGSPIEYPNHFRVWAAMFDACLVANASI